MTRNYDSGFKFTDYLYRHNKHRQLRFKETTHYKDYIDQEDKAKPAGSSALILVERTQFHTQNQVEGMSPSRSNTVDSAPGCLLVRSHAAGSDNAERTIGRLQGLCYTAEARLTLTMGQGIGQ